MNKKGFTLLELLVVVVIIGILAAIALPQYQFAIAKSKFATLKNDVHTLYLAEQRYYLVNNSYTNNKDDLDIEVKGNCSITITSAGKYIRCERRIFGVTMNYLEWIGSPSKDCMTSEIQNLNHVTHKVCQAESGKTTPYVCGESGCQYIWK